MKELTTHARYTMSRHGFPPISVRNLGDVSSHFSNSIQFGLRRTLWNEYAAGDLQPPGTPGQALRKVAGAAGVNATFF